MSQAIITTYKKQFSNLKLTERSRKIDYKENFFDHLDDLKLFDFVHTKQIKKQENASSKPKKGFDFNAYLGLEQFIFDNTNIVEQGSPKEIDWDEIDNTKDILANVINKLLKQEKNSSVLKPMVEFTLDSFENHAIYTYMHPESMYNPWFSTHQMLLSGYLYLISNEQDLIKEFNPKLDIENENSGKGIGLVTKAKNEKSFKGIILGDRFKEQEIVLEYLEKSAIGYRQAKPKRVISKYLTNIGMRISTDFLSTSVLLPLKRSGVIGSTSSGFYFINSEADLKKSYNFHKSKYLAIQKTLTIYEKRAFQGGFELE